MADLEETGFYRVREVQQQVQGPLEAHWHHQDRSKQQDVVGLLTSTLQQLFFPAEHPRCRQMESRLQFSSTRTA